MMIQYYSQRSLKSNEVLGMLLNIVFVAILIWKFVLYFIYLKEFAGLVKWRFFAAFIIMGIIILIMAALNGYGRMSVVEYVELQKLKEKQNR